MMSRSQVHQEGHATAEDGFHSVPYMDTIMMKQTSTCNDHSVNTAFVIRSHYLDNTSSVRKTRMSAFNWLFDCFCHVQTVLLLQPVFYQNRYLKKIKTLNLQLHRDEWQDAVRNKRTKLVEQTGNV